MMRKDNVVYGSPHLVVNSAGENRLTCRWVGVARCTLVFPSDKVCTEINFASREGERRFPTLLFHIDSL